jgi:hypothetical protein
MTSPRDASSSYTSSTFSGSIPFDYIGSLKHKFLSTFPIRSNCLLVATLAIFSVLLAMPTSAKADQAAVGVLSFDVLDPGLPGFPGQNAFTLTNLTGAFSLFPDYPVADNLTLLGASLTPSGFAASSFGDLAPGSSQVAFSASNTFASALLEATLSQTVFTLGDGTTFQADSNLVTVSLLPSSGNSLTPGVDYAILTVSGAPVTSPVPEPPTWVLLVVSLPLLGFSVFRLRR